jgi:hypothetical protein
MSFRRLLIPLQLNLSSTPKQLDRSDFQYCAMDTDSAYIALSATSLEEVIKPDMQQRFQMDKKNWFPRDDTPRTCRLRQEDTQGLYHKLNVQWFGRNTISLL